jgi:hypothetical protein
MNKVKFHVSKALIGYVILGASFGVAGTELAHNANHAKVKATETCRIQRRGLEATRYLVGFTEGVRALLTPQPGQPQKPVPKVYKDIIDRTNYNLDHYIAIQSTLPKKRDCS